MEIAEPLSTSDRPRVAGIRAMVDAARDRRDLEALWSAERDFYWLLAKAEATLDEARATPSGDRQALADDIHALFGGVPRNKPPADIAYDPVGWADFLIARGWGRSVSADSTPVPCPVDGCNALNLHYHGRIQYGAVSADSTPLTDQCEHRDYRGRSHVKNGVCEACLAPVSADSTAGLDVERLARAIKRAVRNPAARESLGRAADIAREYAALSQSGDTPEATE